MGGGGYGYLIILEVLEVFEIKVVNFLLVDEGIRIRSRILEAQTLTYPASDPEY